MDQVTVVRRLDDAIQWLNVNKTNHPIPELDSDLSGGQRYPPYELAKKKLDEYPAILTSRR